MSMEYGAWDKLPHYAVIGSSNNFYVWINDGCTCCESNWIKGRIAFAEYNHLSNLYGKDRRSFIIRIQELHSKYRKQKD